MVQPFLDQQTDDAIGVENEIAAVRILVTDLTEVDFSIVRRWSAWWREGEGTHVSRAISWGVCGRTVTLCWVDSRETVALGFWESGR